MENVAQQKHLFWTLTWVVLLFILGIGMLGCPDEQATFSYSVTIKPEEAVKDGAKWRIDQGEWQESDARVSDVPLGTHTIHFKDIPGWKKPSDHEFSVDESKYFVGKGTYKPISDTPEDTKAQKANQTDEVLDKNASQKQNATQAVAEKDNASEIIDAQVDEPTADTSGEQTEQTEQTEEIEKEDVLQDQEESEALIKLSDEYDVEVNKGFALITIKNIARADKRIVFRYMDNEYVKHFNSQGIVNFQICLRKKFNQISFSRSEGGFKVIDNIVDTNHRRLIKVILQWTIPVDLDLVVAEDKDYVDKSKSKRLFFLQSVPRDFFYEVSKDNTGKTGNTFEEAFVTDDFYDFDDLKFYVRFNQHNIDQSRSYCSPEEDLKINCMILSIYGGIEEVKEKRISSIVCNEEIQNEDVYIPFSLQ